MDTKIETKIKLGDDLPQVYIDDILMSLKYYVDEHESHIHLEDRGVFACSAAKRAACTSARWALIPSKKTAPCRSHTRAASNAEAAG